MELRGMYLLVSRNVSVIINTFSACCNTNLVRAIGMRDHIRVATAGVAWASAVAANLVGCINGTPPGVLLRVCRLCTKGVSLMFRFAVGFRDAIMPGASVMRGMVMMGEMLITLCCSKLTLCSSTGFTGTGGKRGGGVRMSPMCVCRSVSSRCPFVVVPALVPSTANSSVNSRRCWCGVKFGSWQCWGNNLVEPNTG